MDGHPRCCRGFPFHERHRHEPPLETKPAFWGAVAGAIAVLVVVALAPLCVDKFDKAADAAASRAALKKTESWSQPGFVEKGGWATLPGESSPERVTAVARACADLINAA